MSELNIYIGYDSKEAVAWHVLAQSIIETSSRPVALHPVNLKNYGHHYERPHDDRQSNEFSFSRFLVPHLSDYKGYAVFMDCDMMLRADISEIFDVCAQDQSKAVHVVKHDYKPKSDFKYLGNKQYSYPRKNWSSFVVWNCSHPSNNVVTPSFVGNADAATLHRFSWLKDEEIGELDVNWNWLVGEYQAPDQSQRVKNVHWTIGGPYFNEYSDVDFSEEWKEMLKNTNYCAQKP
jgi:hypothetical protein